MAQKDDGNCNTANTVQLWKVSVLHEVSDLLFQVKAARGQRNKAKAACVWGLREPSHCACQTIRV